MHRSGTSALARLLGMMGVFLGEADELLPAHPIDNPTGYWERVDVMRAHDEFLSQEGYAWDRVAYLDLQRFSPGATRELTSKIADLVRQLDAQGTWAIKDPRLCLTLPLWRPFLKSPINLIAIRDPRAIAASLTQSHRGIYTSNFILSLWQKYLQSALQAIRGERAVFVSYERVLSDPTRQAARLFDGLRELGASDLRKPAAEELGTFFDKQLNRSTPKLHVELTANQSALYAWLLESADSAGPVPVSGFPEFDLPDAELLETENSLTDARNRGRQDAVAATNQRLDRIETIMQEHARERQQFQAEIASQRNLTESTHMEFAEQRRIAEALRVALDQLQAEASAQHEKVLELAAQNALLSAERGRLEEQARQERAQHRKIVASLETQLARKNWSHWLKMRFTSAGRLFHRDGTPSMEQRLYRLYYAFPGLSIERKRAAIVWMHRRMPWLTRRSISYQLYEGEVRATEEKARRQRMDAQRASQVIASFGKPPTFRIYAMIDGLDAPCAVASIASVSRQFYPHWTMTVSTPSVEIADAIRAVCGADNRVEFRSPAAPDGPKGAAAHPFDYVIYWKCDGQLTRDALLEFARAGKKEDADLIYGDEDKISRDGKHLAPHFKPDFSPDLLLSTNYVGNLFAVRHTFLVSLSDAAELLHQGRFYDFILRSSEQSVRITHVPHILYHRYDGTAPSGENSLDEIAALSGSLARRGLAAEVQPSSVCGAYRVRRPIAGAPLVSILLPFRDRPDLLRTCIESILEKTDYDNFELVGIDNGSIADDTHEIMRELSVRDRRVRFVRHDIPFNYSAIINYGVLQTKGEHLLMLNNDTEVINRDWIEAMLEHSQRPEIGAVGALLQYPNRRIQHGGVILGFGGSVAGHAHLMLPSGDPGYFGRAQLIQNLSAVTFACAMTRRNVFDELGGLNAINLTAAYNDIDYCLRLREAGYLIVYTPYAAVYHHESASRAHDLRPDQRARYESEIRYMRERHAGILERGDPYYNPNLSLIHNFQPSPDYADLFPT